MTMASRQTTLHEIVLVVLMREVATAVGNRQKAMAGRAKLPIRADKRTGPCHRRRDAANLLPGGNKEQTTF